MRAVTREWLERALDDLKASRALLSHPDLTHLAAFHAQQAVEKAFKAAIEEYDLGSHKTHSLARLLQVLGPHVCVTAEADMLDRLEAVYIEARYVSQRIGPDALRQTQCGGRRRLSRLCASHLRPDTRSIGTQVGQVSHLIRLSPT